MCDDGIIIIDHESHGSDDDLDLPGVAAESAEMLH